MTHLFTSNAQIMCVHGRQVTLIPSQTEVTAAGGAVDLFRSAAPTLAAAPLVMMRGNHKVYDKNADCVGWFRHFA